MEQIVVKTEMQPNGEILLFYVDENDPNASIESHLMQMQGNNEINYEVQLEEVPDDTDWTQPKGKVKWTEEEVQRILVFYVDNKDTFLSGTTKKKDLWAVACKTMLIGKHPEACEVKLRNLKHKYSALVLDQQKGANITWPLFNLCHQAFHNDSYVQYLLHEHLSQQQKKVKVPIESNPIENANSSVIVVKNVNTNKTVDSNVEMMLHLYLRYKKNFKKEYWHKGLWETIAIELGTETSDYWNKKFLNLKQHYLRILSKREQEHPDSAHSWPYKHIFDEIFKDDIEFKRKFKDLEDGTKIVEVQIPDSNEWNDTEKIILVKYYFDCYEEFQDPTIPNNFLWTEVGRLLDKKPEACKAKYEELRKAHLDLYLAGSYSLHERKPLAILFDNIIAKDTEIEIDNSKKDFYDSWTTEEIDQLVQFIADNSIVFKDPVCFNVFWPCLANKLNKSMVSCKRQWEELRILYKSILEDKKENPDMQLDWRYIELFDMIFDYGMDTNLLNNFQQQKDQNTNGSDKIGVRKVKIKTENDLNDISDEEEYDERGFTKRTKRGVGDSKAFKILEYYHKNKDRFTASQRKKQTLWDHLAQQIGISGEQCAHRFRNLKQVYMSYVQREINKPEMPILWPYYALCKKVFGYRAIKSKLKNSKVGSEETEEWAAKEIKQIIQYFAANYNEISGNDDLGKWTPLARDINKSETAVNNKFLELQKSYKRLKTMKENHAECKVTWKYYNMFDDVYTRLGINQNEEMEVDHLIYEDDFNKAVVDSQDEDDDYQCIIVLPEGQELSDIGNTEVVIQPTPNEVVEVTYEDTAADDKKRTVTKWNKRSKKKLLIQYLNYVRSRKGKEINPKEMWTEIASNLPEKTPYSCKKMLALLKANHLKQTDDETANRKKSLYHNLVEKILPLKPRFTKKNPSNSKEQKSYKDVILPTVKVELALQYYLQHIEEFTSPKFEKKYLWTELANFVSEPVNKLFNKINYLKQYFNLETEEVAGEKTLFSELLKEIINKETILKETNQSQSVSLEENEEVIWSDEETEQLLVWYLANLEKFKNPKFVRKYLWIEASAILGKSPLACSKKMTEIRTEYKKMIKESPDKLNEWRFYELCQKIYGTGKKN